LSVLSSYSVVKEPTSVERAANLPDPPVRVKQNVSVLDCSRANPFRLTRTSHVACFRESKRSFPVTPQGPEILGPRPMRCQCLHAPGTGVTLWHYWLFQLAVMPARLKRSVALVAFDNLSLVTSIPAPSCISFDSPEGYGAMVQRSSPAWGPCRTAPPTALFLGLCRPLLQ
jgi:hypothetical protein